MVSVLTTIRTIVGVLTAVTLVACGGAVDDGPSAGTPGPASPGTVETPQATSSELGDQVLTSPAATLLTDEAPPSESFRYDWNANPFDGYGPSKRVSSAEAAASAVGIPTSLPVKTLGTPSGIYITDPAATKADSLEVVATWTKTALGPIQMFELTNNMTQAQLEGLVTSCTACSDARTVKLPDGAANGIALAAPGRTTAIHWLRHGVLYTIMGSYESVTTEDLEKLAAETMEASR